MFPSQRSVRELRRQITAHRRDKQVPDRKHDGNRSREDDPR